MALSTNETEQCYSILVQSVKQHGLDWVIDQVESQIALGKVRTGRLRAKEVPLSSDSHEDINRLSKGRPTQFTISEEFTPSERLLILIEALRHAVSGVWKIASAVSQSMSDSVSGVNEIGFAPEGISKKPFVLKRAEIHRREDAVKRFDKLIREIEEAI